jgi:glycosyltransferase involved in cell wall biosynthesis
MVRLANDETLRRSLGEGAAQKARAEFSLDKQALAIESFYERMLRVG